MARTIVAVNKQGRITLPAEARRRLALKEGSHLEVAVEGGELRLRPARLVRVEEQWLHTAEVLESIRQGLADIQAGRVYRASREDLEAGRVPTGATRRKR